jgi:zinc transport system permease protein
LASPGDEPSQATDAELDEIEQALDADTFDHSHEEHHLDVETSEGAPTWDDLADNWDLFQDPIAAAGIAGLVLGFLSVYVVLRRMVFVSAAVSQAAGFGIALAFYLAARFAWHVDPVLLASTLSLVTAAMVGPDLRRLGLSREMVLGLLFALFAGGAVVLAARIPQEAHDVQAILFGTAVVVGHDDLIRLLTHGGAIVLLQLWWFRGFAFASFDPLAARVQGLPVRLLDIVLLVCIGVMVGESARALGALPAFALSVLPGVAAVQLARGPLIVTFAVAAVLGAACGAGGYLVAFFLELPVGATQAVVAGLTVVAATGVRLLAATITHVLARKG